jgi:hypothetical protein
VIGGYIKRPEDFTAGERTAVEMSKRTMILPTHEPMLQPARTLVCVDIGSPVSIGPEGDQIAATVIEILVKEGGHVQYRLAWFNGKSRSTDWFGRDEFRTRSGAKNLGIGFKQGVEVTK